MQTIDPSLNSIFSAYVFIGGCFLILMWIGSVLYLKYKWLSFVEKTIDEDSYSFSSGFFSAGLGVSRYALIFQFDWQARRCNRLKQREFVPQRVQKLFIMSNYLWLVASIVFFGPMFLI
jgi:hypothetical protein